MLHRISVQYFFVWVGRGGGGGATTFVSENNFCLNCMNINYFLFVIISNLWNYRIQQFFLFCSNINNIYHKTILLVMT